MRHIPSGADLMAKRMAEAKPYILSTQQTPYLFHAACIHESRASKASGSVAAARFSRKPRWQPIAMFPGTGGNSANRHP